MKTFAIYVTFIMLSVLAASAVPFRVEEPLNRRVVEPININPLLTRTQNDIEERVFDRIEERAFDRIEERVFEPDDSHTLNFLPLFSPDIDWGSVEERVPFPLRERVPTLFMREPTLSEKVHLIQAQCDTLKRKIEERKNGNSNQASRQPN